MLAWQSVQPVVRRVLHDPCRDHAIEPLAHVTFMKYCCLGDLSRSCRSVTNHRSYQTSFVTDAHQDSEGTTVQSREHLTKQPRDSGLVQVRDACAYRAQVGF